MIDTELTDDLRAEGDARELQRAIQDLRKEAGLALDDRIELWLADLPNAIEPHLAAVAEEVLADVVHRSAAPAGADVTTGSVALSAGPVGIGLRRSSGPVS